MRVAIRIPTLGFHFSPARYHRLMQVVNIFQKEDTVDLPRPWFESDFEGWLSLLSWKVYLNELLDCINIDDG